MSTPPKATPTTPQWAIEAAKELSYRQPTGCNRDVQHQLDARIITKHAPPPAAPPSDPAGLQEVILTAVLEDHTTMEAKRITDRILTALAPYLKGEPGDSELRRLLYLVLGPDPLPHSGVDLTPGRIDRILAARIPLVIDPELLEWVKRKTEEAEKSLKMREDDAALWRTGTDASWAAAAAMHPSTRGKALKKAQRLEHAATKDRIVIKVRHEVSMWHRLKSAMRGEGDKP